MELLTLCAKATTSSMLNGDAQATSQQQKYIQFWSLPFCIFTRSNKCVDIINKYKRTNLVC